MMKERPILFSAAMIKALLNGSKTQTRRIIKPNPDIAGHFHEWTPERTDHWLRFCPYGQIGDRLWVRETWAPTTNLNHDRPHLVFEDVAPKGLGYSADKIIWRADGEMTWCDDDGGITYNQDGSEKSLWRPSIFMPRWASRITLEITNIRVERLQDITEGDAMEEGVEPAPPHGDYPVSWKRPFISLWQEINGVESWNCNPYVWALTFKVVTP